MSSLIARFAVDEPPGSGPFRFGVGSEIRISGWAFAEPVDAALPDLTLEVLDAQSGATECVQVSRRPRPDVAHHFGERTLMSGFEGRFVVGHPPRGTRTVRLHVGQDGSVAAPVDLFSFAVIGAQYELDVRAQLATRFLSGKGIEIGALQRRLAVPAHCTVTYVDRMGLAELLEHYPELKGLPIQEPDLIDDGETLSKVPSASQRFVIANHFLEHCESPIQTLLNLARVLAEGGILYMAVPDKRFTFDFGRPTTPYPVLAEAFQTGRRGDRVQMYREWAQHVLHTPEADIDRVAEQLIHEEYSIHFNVWTLPELIAFLLRSREDFGIPVTLEWVVSSDNEVILILRKESSTNGSLVS